MTSPTKTDLDTTRGSSEASPQLVKPDDLPQICGGPCRTIIWQAMNPDPEYRCGLPYLEHLKIRRGRWVDIDVYRAWLSQFRTQPLDHAA